MSSKPTFASGRQASRSSLNADSLSFDRLNMPVRSRSKDIWRAVSPISERRSASRFCWASSEWHLRQHRRSRVQVKVTLMPITMMTISKTDSSIPYRVDASKASTRTEPPSSSSGRPPALELCADCHSFPCTRTISSSFPPGVSAYADVKSTTVSPASGLAPVCSQNAAKSSDVPGSNPSATMNLLSSAKTRNEFWSLSSKLKIRSSRSLLLLMLCRVYQRRGTDQ
mmetsp:Transcript_29274/g.59889  ORF Transcript_29274/g.59889 Transcript_29274/m.59889 type:complete len:226 (-) Transcript_29274:9-686(-)